MASIKRTKSDAYEIRVVIDGQRRSYYPGAKVRTETQASDVAEKLERLAYCCENDELVPKHVIAWAKALPDRQHNRLADWELVERCKPKLEKCPRGNPRPGWRRTRCDAVLVVHGKSSIELCVTR